MTADTTIRPIVCFTPQLNNAGGTERATLELMKRLAIERDVTVFVFDSDVEPNARLKIVKWRSVPGPQLVRWLAFLLRSTYAAARLRRKRRPPIIFTPGVNLLGADLTIAHLDYDAYRRARRKYGNEPAPVTLKQKVRLLHSGLYSLAVALVERIHYRRSRFVMAVSPSTKASLEARGIAVWGIAPNGVDPHVFQASGQSDRVRPQVLTVGSEIGIKGLDLVLCAMAREELRDRVSLKIVTRSTNIAALEGLARKLSYGQLVTVSAGVPAATLFDGCDFYVASSRYDSFNMPALEAMSIGLPIVVTRECGIASWLSDSEAEIVDPEPAAIAAAVTRLLNSPHRCQALADAGKRFAQTMTWDVVAEAVAEPLRQLDAS